MDENQLPLHLTLLLIMFFVLFGASAFFSGSETAVFSADWLRIRYRIRKGDRKARILQALLERRDILIATILVGNTLANVAASSIATAVALPLFGENGIVIATGAMTLLVLVLAEIAPKTFASQHAERVALFVAPVFAVLTRALLPAVTVVTFASNSLLRLVGFRPQVWVRPKISGEEIHSLVSERGGLGDVEEGKRRMLHGIFQMGRQTVREVMIPRTRVHALDVATPIDEAVQEFVRGGYTRLPVYRETLDGLIGVAHARDALALISKGDEGTLASIVHEPFFVPECQDLESLLYDFQRRRTHMAVVVDEYGGVEGIVTLEDVIEEIVGEIRDEYDVEGEAIRFLPRGEAMVHGAASIREVDARLGLSLPHEPDVTLGGFVMTRLGHIPQPGEKLSYGGAVLSVERTGRNRVLLVRVTPVASREAAEKRP